MNTYNRMFAGVINPKLSTLISSVSVISDLNSQVLKYISNLYLFESKLINIDFDSISSLLPSESIFKPLIESIKKRLETIISHFDLSITTNIIDQNLLCIVKEFDKKFESASKEISTKLSAHIEKIESNIKSIFNETKGSIRIINSKIDDIKIGTHISNLEQNNSSLSKFDKYDREEKLMKRSEPTPENESGNLSQTDMDKIRPFYLPLKLYKRRMISHSSIKSNLSELKTKLTVIENTIKQICQKITEYESNLPDPSEIDKLLVTMAFLKDRFINKLRHYENNFYTLEQIGLHIRSLQSFCSSELKDKLDPEFCNAVNSLKDIYVKERLIHTLIITLKKQLNYIMDELQLIKLLLQYRNSLRIMLLPLNSLYLKCNVNEFLKNSRTIIQTLSDASKTIETTTQKIEELKTKHGYLYNYVPGDLDRNFKSYISPIPGIIKEISAYLTIVRYIIYELQIIKSNSTNTIEEIKNKIEQIKDVYTALTNLKEIYNDIIIQYIILWVLLC